MQQPGLDADLQAPKSLPGHLLHLQHLLPVVSCNKVLQQQVISCSRRAPQLAQQWSYCAIGILQSHVAQQGSAISLLHPAILLSGIAAVFASL